MRKQPGVRAFQDNAFWLRTAAAVAALSIGLVAVAFQFSGTGLRETPDGVRTASGSGLGAGEKAATIQVTEGSGWLSTGEEIQIAEWYTGTDGKAGEYFANFRGSEGGATVDLRLAGLNSSGTFACAEPGQSPAMGKEASVELRVDVENTYRPGLQAGSCEVTVTRIDGQIMEGRYSATLVNAGNESDDVTITGTFRATRPQAERLSAIATEKVAEL